MKINRIKIPYLPNKVPYRPIPESYDYLPFKDASEDDSKQMEQYVKEGKLKEFNDLVNEKVAGMEQNPNHFPGLATRDFLSSALTKSIKRRYPELSNLPVQDQISILQQKVYPGLDQLERAAGRVHSIDFDKSGNVYHDPQTGRINLNVEDPNILESSLHEMGHAIDTNIKELNKLKNLKELPPSLRKQEPDEQDYARRSKAMEEFIKQNPKIKELLKTKMTETTNSEQRPLDKYMYRRIKKIMPNLEDYNYETGEFGSDILEDPIEKYKEVGGEHHLERPFSLDNFINFSKGDLKDIVKVKDRFGNLIKKLG